MFFRAAFREVTRGMWVWMLEPKRRSETYRACVLTLRNTQEWPALMAELDLSLKG